MGCAPYDGDSLAGQTGGETSGWLMMTFVPRLFYVRNMFFFDAANLVNDPGWFRGVALL
jgi:hypothetical protein